ncbi:hypothetical protein H6G95_12540 [Nostoc linckia FACHB-391]|uniref:Uncharacterized protein n=1 Tax=Nostoc linckia FACHB-391 TaxID=2692906 RepID=A0ABR8EXQ9_NOSLI|nr:hypothetical protein [Nostoc linckia FACHB-391]
MAGLVKITHKSKSWLRSLLRDLTRSLLIHDLGETPDAARRERTPKKGMDLI